MVVASSLVENVTVDAEGRLAPIAALVHAARNGAADLATRLEERYAVGEPGLPGWDQGKATLWHDTGLFSISSPQPPTLSIDRGEPMAMTAIAGTPYWFKVATLEEGRLHFARYTVGEWSREIDVAGYNAYSYDLPDVRRGTLSERHTVASRIYPGATTAYWLYVNHGIDEVRGAPVMIWHDGQRRLEPHDLSSLRMQIVTDNLVHLGLIPPMVHVLVPPSSGGESCRSDSTARAARCALSNTAPCPTVRPPPHRGGPSPR